MVVYDIHNDSDSACVALVDELLVLLACAVLLVEGEPVVRVISPAEVTVKLLDRHQLHSGHSEIGDIVQLRHRSSDILCLREIAEMHLIYHKVILVSHLEILMLPRIFRIVDLESRDILSCIFRKLGSSFDITVI